MNFEQISPDTAELGELLDYQEAPALHRLMTTVGHLFRVPIAYIGLLGRGHKVVNRIGIGTANGKFLRTLPPGSLYEPYLLRDTATAQPDNSNCGAVRFVATAPLRSRLAHHLGVLAIGDFRGRPDFSEADHNALTELATIVADQMYFQVLAFRALHSVSALREEQLRLRSILDSIPALILYGGPDGACRFVNRSWQEFTGQSMDEAMGDGWEECLEPASRAIVREKYWQAMAARQPFQLEFHMRRHDGEYRRIAGHGVPRFLEDGTFAGLVGSLEDITDYVARQTDLLQIEEALAETLTGNS